MSKHFAIRVMFDRELMQQLQDDALEHYKRSIIERELRALGLAIGDEFALAPRPGYPNTQEVFGLDIVVMTPVEYNELIEKQRRIGYEQGQRLGEANGKFALRQAIKEALAL